jgi:alkanesulfonate monooxygenase SsuD/methylene tetrahydromethanopterin reductase-like flavin-dependent oxidoreductase (luciferase family)
MWQLWQQGDRAAATQAVPDDIVDELVLHGSPRSCRDQVRRYIEAGVQVPVLAVLPTAGTAGEAGLAAVLAELGPAELGPAEVGPAEVGPAEVGPAGGGR